MQPVTHQKRGNIRSNTYYCSSNLPGLYRSRAKLSDEDWRKRRCD